MNKYDVYKKYLQEEVDELMERKVKDMKSLEYLDCLFHMISCLCEKSKEYVEETVEIEQNNIEDDIDKDKWVDKVPDSLVDERMYGMIEHFRMYKEYKTMYRKSKDDHDKKLMLEELKHMIEQHQLIVEEIMSCGLDCQEEKMFIKEFLQKTYKAIS